MYVYTLYYGYYFGINAVFIYYNTNYNTNYSVAITLSRCIYSTLFQCGPPYTTISTNSYTILST